MFKRRGEQDIVLSLLLHRKIIKKGLTLTLVSKDEKIINIPIYFPEPKPEETVIDIIKIIDEANNVPSEISERYYDLIILRNTKLCIDDDEEEEDSDEEDIKLEELDCYNAFGNIVEVKPILPFIPLSLFKEFYLWVEEGKLDYTVSYVRTAQVDEPILDTGYEVQTEWGGHEKINLLPDTTQ